jgi:hypothetical protein
MPDTSTLDLTQWELLTEKDFNSMVFDSGVFVKNFDPEQFTTPSESDVLFATGGDINITHNTKKVNLGDGVNNIHFPYGELMIITGVDAAQITVSSFDFSPDGLKFALGAADVTEETGAVTPRYYIKSSDFTTNFAWIGVKKGGGLVAIVIPMALSTGGLSISAKKGDKGTSQLTIGAFRSINAKSTPEMMYYSASGGGITITSQPVSKTVEAGTATSFSVTASGTSSLSYQWQLCAVGDATFADIEGETTSTLTLATSDVIEEASGNKYRCKITMSGEVRYTIPAQLTVTTG